MLLKSEIRVAALVRTIQAHNGAAYIRRRGHGEAGDIAVVVLDTATKIKYLYQRIGTGDQAGFVLVETSDFRESENFLGVSETDICDIKLERAVRFDPDLWIVDIEIKNFDKEWLT
jgi:hypothetical protein